MGRQPPERRRKTPGNGRKGIDLWNGWKEKLSMTRKGHDNGKEKKINLKEGREEN